MTFHDQTLYAKTLGMAIDDILARLDRLPDEQLRWAVFCSVFDVLCARAFFPEPNPKET